MSERPILFSAPMVRALLAGTKTQTRRALRNQPSAFVQTIERVPANGKWKARHWEDEWRCPYGEPGDRLWVRESCFIDDRKEVIYRADGTTYAAHYKATPSIHMPRWASRITLEVTGIWVERLHAIRQSDAEAEGVDCIKAKVPTPRDAYRYVWEDINGPGSWDANPWVWVVEFRRAA